MRILRTATRLLAALAALAPGAALALENRFITFTSIPGAGRQVTYAEAMSRIVNFAAASSVLVATTMFLVGAFTLVSAGFKPDLKDAGKKLMTNSLIGLAVVLLAYTILRTFLYILFII